ncbi:MAG TPA: DinB family protein [Panacibacter sp.]|nr:DinB family protein [Panacibacter sp.]
MLSDIEKTYATGKLENTREKLSDELNGLSETQLTYKPDAEIWSITEIMEHIALAENGIWQAVRQGLTKDTDESRRNEILLTDEAVYSRTASRNFKAISPEVIKPAGKFSNAEAALAFFTKRRNASIEYVNTTEDDLRNRYWRHPFAGLIDLYQTILFIAGHCARHTAQITELKQSAGFPQQ